MGGVQLGLPSGRRGSAVPTHGDASWPRAEYMPHRAIVGHPTPVKTPPPFRLPTPREAFALYVGACFVAIVLMIAALAFYPWSIPFVMGGAVAEAYWLARWFDRRSN